VDVVVDGLDQGPMVATLCWSKRDCFSGLAEVQGGP
jgi:hypothetical protein